MSDLTPCNYCNLNRIKRYAKREGRTVALHPGVPTQGLPGDVNIYVVPPGEELITGDESPHFAAWFMELTNHCVC